MNDPAVKVALAISLLAGGIFIAIVFRPVLSTSPAFTPELNNTLSLQHLKQAPPPTPPSAKTPVSTQLKEQISAISDESSNGPTILTPFGPPQPVPNLPPRYPLADSTNSASWGMPKEMMPIVARQAKTPRVHKIVDGDTLRDLAQLYLGSADRAMEIFHANRDVLTDQNLLPIGVELKIPRK